MRRQLIRISLFLTYAALVLSNTHAMEKETPNIERSSKLAESTTPFQNLTAEQWKIMEKEGTGEYARFGAGFGGRYSKELRIFPSEKSKSAGFFAMIFIAKVEKLEIAGLHKDGKVEVVDAKDMYYLHILPFPWDFFTGEKKEFVVGLVKDFQLKGIKYIQEGDFQEGNGIYSCYHKKCYMDHQAGEILSVFYHKKLIPDYLIDRITQYTGLSDFRLRLGA